MKNRHLATTLLLFLLIAMTFNVGNVSSVDSSAGPLRRNLAAITLSAHSSKGKQKTKLQNKRS